MVLNAILYILRGVEPWRLLPHEDPPWQSVYDQLRRCRGGPRQDPVGPQCPSASAGRIDDQEENLPAQSRCRRGPRHRAATGHRAGKRVSPSKTIRPSRSDARISARRSH
ncbi:transposase [Microvirga sp. M2]|uniref:transposase n=1 Tax=Microvirga sp. M2 TaxID=3073270 RepID=UPI0039C3D3B0